VTLAGDGGAAGSPNLTPTGLDALKVKPSAQLSPTTASNCSRTLRGEMLDVEDARLVLTLTRA